jgi:hypothetical protein
MMADLPYWLMWRPWPPGDPGPEVYHLVNELSPEQKVQVIGVINAARADVEAARAAGYKQIGAAIGQASQG